MQPRGEHRVHWRFLPFIERAGIASKSALMRESKKKALTDAKKRDPGGCQKKETLADARASRSGRGDAGN
jgi:hypothetical protein